ncbi:MAG: helix-turn-helix transcriptional regulator [Verrucomicrobiota bacterium]
MKRLSKKALDGNVETLLMAILEKGPSYGYKIVQELNDLAPHHLKMGEGTVYPVLHRLEERKLIKPEWKAGETGRQRKYYSLTTSGERAFAANREEWAALTKVMSSILGDNSAQPQPA